MEPSVVSQKLPKRQGLNRMTPTRIIIFGYLAIILLGAALLCLPISSQARIWTDPLTAVFTATSATCVTGLVVVNTAAHWSLFGQLIILVLIQIGGMGFLTMAVLVSMAAKRRIGLRQRFTMQESISAPTLGGIVRLTSFIFRGVVLIEGIGAFILALRFIPLFGGARGLYYAVFHSISAFCNAGFDLLGTFEGAGSLTYFVEDPIVNLTCAALILVGGLGFFVWEDLYKKRFAWKRYLLQTKLVLVMLTVLVVFPTVLLWIFEHDGAAFAGLSGPGKVLAAFFQACTARTAGFNTVDLASLSGSGSLLMLVLMFIGAGPGSTGGGVKITTVAVCLLSLFSYARGKRETSVFNRRLDDNQIKRSAAGVTLYFVFAIAGCYLLTVQQPFALVDALFEIFSALSTVGLTTGVTQQLNSVNKLLLILMMYAGRIGSLTMIMAVVERLPARVKDPIEHIVIG